MQKKIFYLFMILCTVSFFSSCKDDDKIDDGPKTDWAEEIAGTYKGDLGVTVDGNDLGSSTQFIYISRENTNVTKLELRNFKIMIAGTALQVGDIIVSNIPVTDANTTVMLEQTSTVINHQALGQLNVTVSGTITNGKAALQITVFAVTLGQNIEVSFSGNKTDEVEDNTDYAAEVAAWYARESLTITGDTIDSKWPSDGISVEYEDFNTIFIKSFYLSFPANEGSTTTTRSIPQIDSIVLVKDGSKLLIDTITMMVPPRSKQDTSYLVLSGDFEGKTLTLNMTLSTKDKKADYLFKGTKKLTGATLESLTLNSSVLAIQPEISKEGSGSNYPVMIYVKEGTTEAQLNLVPTFKISEGATITQGGVEYVPGTPVDFSKEQKFTVNSQSGKTKNTYVINYSVLNTNFAFASGFETWELKNETTDSANMYLMYDEPADGWATSNEGAKWIKMMYDKLYSKTAPYPVTPSEDAKSGKAARLETLNTTGQAGFGGFIPAIPKVTSGTVFSGEFIVNISNTLKSTKFGYPCTKKPISFQGSYKYTPGPTYYVCADPTKANEVKEDNSKTDAPAINAVLYEVDSYAFDFLDGTNLQTSEKIVAKASLKDETAKPIYTDFNINFDWGSNKFDPTKKYKLAIVCSSSKDGDKFSGAPGSVLYVDDLKVTFE